MKFIPYDSFQIKTTLDAAEVERLIAANTEAPKRWYLTMPEPDFFFKGWIRDCRFEVERNTNYRKNSFAPAISGVIENVDEQSVIKLKLVPKEQAIWFMLLFLLGAFAGATVFIISEIRTRAFVWDDLRAYGPFLFGYLLMMVSFNFERMWAKKFIIKLMLAQEIILAN
jgi:hypothetical protein